MSHILCFTLVTDNYIKITLVLKTNVKLQSLTPSPGLKICRNSFMSPNGNIDKA